MANPFSAYQKQSVTTMTSSEVLIKLYNELEKQIALAINKTENKDFSSANEHFQKAQRAIMILRESLDMNVGISKNLESLYEYLNYVIIQANIKKDVTELKESAIIVTELRDAFSTISTMPKSEIDAQNRAIKQA